MWRLPFFSLCLLLLVQQTRPGRAQSIETRPAKADAAVLVCRDKISSALGPTHLISPEGIHVDVPEKDVEAALARGFKWDMETLQKDARSYGKGDKQSPEQTILAKLSDEALDTLQSDIFLCMSKQRDVLSRQDLVDSGIAMAEIAYAKQYRYMGNLVVKNDEERVKEYNALAAKYNELLARCPH